MNFLCENCKQKYHVADEKLRGREVTKFKCKKCEHIIEVRGDAVDAGDDAAEPGSASMLSSVPPASAAAPVAPKPAAPRPATAGLPTAGAPKPAVTAAPRPAGTGFPAAGASKPATTSGLPTAGAPKPAVSPVAKPAATAAPRPAGSALPTAGSAARAASPAASPSPAGVTALKPAAAAAPKPAAQPSALRSSITHSPSPAAHEPTGPRRTPSSSSTSALLNSSETGWYAGIREVPVGPLTRAELASKIDAGDITSETLVWREGLDDWRPLSAVNELSDLLREASKRVSDTMLGAQAKKAPSNVVPLSRANTQKDVDEPEESTRLTSLSDLIATAEGGSPHKKPAIKSEPAPEIKPEPKAPAHEFKPEAPVAAAPVAAATTAKAEPEPDLDDPFFAGPAKKAPAVAAAAAVPAATAAPMVAPAPAVKAEANPYGLPLKSEPAATLPSIPPPKEEKKGGVPMGMIVMFGGMLVLVGGGGLYAGTRINNQQQQVQPPVQQPAQQPAQPTPPLDRAVGAQVDLTHEPANTPPANTPPANTTGTPAAANTPPTPSNGGGSHASSGGSHSGTPRSSSATSTSPATTGLSAEQIRQMQIALGTAPSGVGAGSGGGPVGTVARNTPSPSASEPVAGPTGSARAGQVLETFRRTNVVGSCWQQQITRNPAHPPERLNVTLTVSPTGRATAVNVAGANDPALASCIQSRARSQNFGPGGQVDAQASFNLAIGN